MAGAVQKKINDVVNELNNAPDNHLLAREGILESITLTREFAQTMLNALCEKLVIHYHKYVRIWHNKGLYVMVLDKLKPHLKNLCFLHMRL